MTHKWMAAGLTCVATMTLVGTACSSSSTVVRSGASTTAPSAPAPCPAESIVVHGLRGERMHPDLLPPGFVLRNGVEDDLGARGQLEYTIPNSTGDAPRIELLRYHTSMPLEQLTASGNDRPVTVQGKQGLASSDDGHAAVSPGPTRPGAPKPPTLVFRAVSWWDSPGTALVVSGANLDANTVLDVAQHVHYDPGTTFDFPAHPEVSVTRANALSGRPTGATAKLTSFGEVDALVRRSLRPNPPATIAPAGGAIPVEQPVWLVATAAGPSQPGVDHVAVVDGVTGHELVSVDAVPGDVIDAITDRSLRGCNPPFGIITRSEMTFAQGPQRPGTTTALKLVTLGALTATTTGKQLAGCFVNGCPADVPVWVVLTTAPDHSLAEGFGRGPGVAARPSTTTPPDGSWLLRGSDARTGPSNTDVANSAGSGVGAPPADVVALDDLAPA